MYFSRCVAALTFLLAIACNDFEAPRSVDSRASSLSPSSFEPSIDQVDAGQAPNDMATDVASEPVPVAGSFLVCSLRIDTIAPQGTYPVYCQVPMEDAPNWTFAYSRNGANPVATRLAPVDGVANQWFLRIPILPSDTSIRIDAQFALPSGGDANVPKNYTINFPEDVLKPHKEANVSPPAEITATDSAVLTTSVAGLKAYFTAGPLAADNNDNLTVQTLTVSASLTPTQTAYELRLRKTSTGAYQIITHKPTPTTDSCMDIRGQNIDPGAEVISFACKSISLSQNQAFLTLMEPDLKSFKIQSSAERDLCVGLQAGTNKMILVNCTAAATYQLSRLPAAAP